MSSSLSVVLFLLTLFFLLHFTFLLFLFMANSSDSMNLNTLCNSANGTFVTLDDCLPDTTEVAGKTTCELEDELEENSMTIYVRTSSGKTIRIKCDKKQKAATILEKVERRSSIPRTYFAHQGKVMKEKKTIR